MLVWRAHSVGHVMWHRCQGQENWRRERWERAICAALAISHLTDAQHIYPTPSLFYFPPSLKLAAIHLQPAHQSTSHSLLLFCTSVCVSFPYIPTCIPTYLMLSKTSRRTPVIVGFNNWLEGHWHQLAVCWLAEIFFQFTVDRERMDTRWRWEESDQHPAITDKHFLYFFPTGLILQSL